MLIELCGMEGSPHITLHINYRTPMRKTEPPPPPVQPTRRSVSTRFSSRTTLPRTSSVIIHETGDEDLGANTQETELITEETTQAMEEPPQEPPEPPSLPRTRKAKDTQRRLGVGRPIAAGGSGPRAVTKSLSVSRSRRAKSSRNVIPVEDTIPEEGALPLSYPLNALNRASRF